jgi:alpha-glucosidase
LSYSNNTLHASISGEYNDDLPLANVTIVGATGKAGGVAVNCGGSQGQRHTGWSAEHGNATSGVQYRFENNVMYITGLESETQGGVWNNDLEIKLS